MADCKSGQNYTTTREELHSTKPQVASTETCAALTAAGEGNANSAAWTYYDQVADAYCLKGAADCPKGQTCKSTVTNKSAKKTGTRGEFIPVNPGDPASVGTLKCYVTFELTADIQCTCQ